MKKLLLILICLPFIGFGQSVPQGINYQAVARDTNGDVLMNQALTIQFSVISDLTTSAVSWQETHSVSTNDYGLFTAIIGQGTSTSIGSSATFDVIDWGASNHLLKVEIDYGGGLVDMGTTAFMSVPYAIYSNNNSTWKNNGSDIYFSSGNVGIGQSRPNYKLHVNNDNIFDTSSVVYSRNSSFMTQSYAGHFKNRWSGNDARLGGINYAGFFNGNVNVSGNLINNNVHIKTYKVGDFAHGGIVFWLDESGQHGLVCAKYDQNTGSIFVPLPPAINMTNCYGDGIGSGLINTIMILKDYDGYTATPGANSYPALDCVNFSTTENNILYGDWYLPSKYELNLMFLNRQLIDSVSIINGGSSFLPFGYWSSTQSTTQYANIWSVDFGTGLQHPAHKTNNSNYRTRAVRKF